MKALVLTSPGAFEVREVAIPKPGQGEVLCRIRGVAICGSDPEIIRGGLAGIWPPAYPFIPGHEWSGEIVEVGDGVIGFTPGDRVAGEAHKGCGYCRNCLEGRYNLCENYGRPETGHRHYGFISQGAYAQYNAYSIRSVNLLPPTISFREGALVDTVGAGLHGLELAGVRPGGTVVIIGPGPIGLLAMRFATALGAARVIVVGRGARLKAAAAMGANAVVDIQQEDPVKAVRGLTDGLGVDLVCECSGAPGTFAQAVRMVRKGGKVSRSACARHGCRGLPYNTSCKTVAIFVAREPHWPEDHRHDGLRHIEVATSSPVQLEDFAKGLVRSSWSSLRRRGRPWTTA
jgi:L-iditol 2-dehydrogenase